MKDYRAISREKYLFGAFIVSIFIFYLLWTFLIPFDGGPDERMRYQIPLFIHENGFLPAGDDPSIRDHIWGNSYAFTPITSYIISALFMGISSLFTPDEHMLLMSARLVSTLCATATVAICIPIAQRLFKNNICVKWTFLVFVALLPEFCFISGYVNIDAFAMLSTAVIIYAWVLGLQEHWPYRSCVILGMGLSACLLSYYNAYGFILCSIFLFFVTILGASRGSNSTGDIVKKTALIVGLVFVLAGWWFIRNGILYDGDILGFQASNKCGEMYAPDGFKPSDRAGFTPLGKGYNIFQMLFGGRWIIFVFLSFIGWFGQFSVPLPFPMYAVYILIFAMAIVGCFMGFRKFFPKFKDKLSKKTVWFNLTMMMALIFPFLINMIYSYGFDYQKQGRYSLPALIPMMFFFAKGISIFLQKFCKDRKKLKAIITFIICSVYVFLAVYSLFGVLCTAPVGGINVDKDIYSLFGLFKLEPN